MKKTIPFKLLAALFPVFMTSQALSWGGRGHDTICETAAFLVEEPGLKAFLKSRSHTMGHLCNLPDIQWRSIADANVKASGDPTHYVEPDILGLKPTQTSTDIKKLQLEWTGKNRVDEPNKKIFQLTREMGSLWWRVDQFMRLKSQLKEGFAKSQPPANKQEEQNDQLPFNQNTYQFMVYAGLMGHFVGDASMPYHNTINYDGYKNGHGGIHAYYEEQSVSENGIELQNKVYQAAKKFKSTPWKNSKLSTIEKLQIFSEEALADLKEVEKRDPIIKKSEVKSENGMNLRTPAERKDAQVGAKIFEPLIIKQMAKSSALLAHLWDEAYRSVGKPELSKYKSYRYPLTADFIFPDYEETPAKSAK
ncbi:MAG: hypothetical protein ACK5W9_13735 [Bdellovibrionales bacterium]